MFVGWLKNAHSSIWQRVCEAPTTAAALKLLLYLTSGHRNPGTQRFVTSGETPDEFFDHLDTEMVLRRQALANATPTADVPHREGTGPVTQRSLKMKVLSAFASDWFKAEEFGDGEARTLTIKRVTVEKVGDDEKPVVQFCEGTQGLVLNKTNATAIVGLYGEDTDSWVDKKITIFRTVVDFGGKVVPALRVKAPVNGQAPRPTATAPTPAAAPAPKPPPPRPPAASQAPNPPSLPNRQFWCLDADGQTCKEPADEHQVQTYIASSKIDPKTYQVCLVGTEEWKPAADFGFKDTVPW
jgi:hypothetical protein